MSNVNISGMISIIFFTYNGVPFLEDSLASVIDQTYDKLEIIVVDNGSTDDTVDVVMDLLKDSGREYSIYHTNGPSMYTPMTLRYSAAYGIMNCSGEFIGYHSDDNVSVPWKYHKLVGMIGSAPMSYGNFMEVDEDGEILSEVGWTMDWFLNEFEPIMDDIILGNDVDMMHTARLLTECGLMRKDIFMRQRLYIPMGYSNPKSYDAEIPIQMAYCAAGRIVYTTEPLTMYMTHPFGTKKTELNPRCSRFLEGIREAGYDPDEVLTGRYNYIQLSDRMRYVDEYKSTRGII